MKRGTTAFLKITIVLLGILIMMLCAFILFWLMNHPVTPDDRVTLYPILIGMYASAIPFYSGLFAAYQLLVYIDDNKAFSQSSVKALKSIKNCAAAVSLIYAMIMPFVYLLADKEDAPGLIIVGLVPVLAALVIAVFAAVLQQLLHEAIEIKAENELTV